MRTAAGRQRRASWLVLGCYLLAAVAVTARLWADPAGHAQAANLPDEDQFTWFMRYAAAAVSHGRLPALVTTAMNAPQGINLMGNTSVLLPGVLLTPVTLLAGPQVSLTVLLTLGFAGSAASMFWVLRRWDASLSAAALGGAVYGFSPALLNSGIGHYQLQFAVLPPLIIDVALRILTGRARPVRAGAVLGLLAAAQVFIGEELLAQTAVAAALLAVTLAASRPHAVRGHIRPAAAGLSTAAAVTLAICGYALWVQFVGPASLHGSPWHAGAFHSYLAVLVTPPGDLLFHTAGSAGYAAAYPGLLPEYLGYLGWPLLVVLLAAAVCCWPDLRARASAVTFAALELFTLGSAPIPLGGLHYPGVLLPWYWLRHLPVLGAILPDRFAILADGAAAALLAFGLDRARAALPQSASLARRAIPAAITVLAVLLLVPLPMPTAPAAPVPAGWQAAVARLRLPSDAPVLVVPVFPQVLRWQADTGEPASLIDGRCFARDKAGLARPCVPRRTPTARYLNALWGGDPGVPAVPAAKVRAQLASWRTAAVVAVTPAGSPLARFLAGLLGPPATRAGQVIGWRLR
ncbi:MAG TPA: hypothetical protein VMV17_18300 [Streptosporangiaceae bacterium]|nr:hypothetical protein [Streptosporangiaceae bacterium]